MRQLTLLFGSTTLAATATLSALFLGSAAGSLLLGARSRRWPRPVLAYGLLEIGIALGALVVPSILHAYGRLYPGLYLSLAPHPAAFAFAKLFLAMVALAPATFLMGGTLPALGEAVAPRGGRGEAASGLGQSAGGLYAANVLGAAIGALAVPFALLPGLGVSGAYWATIAGSVLLGLLAFAVGMGARRPDAEARQTPAAPADARSVSPRLLLLAAWSGACVLGIEVLGTRMLSLVHDSSVHSFAVVLVVFLAGLAGGAALSRAWLRRRGDPRRLLGWAWAVAGALTALVPLVFDHLTGGLQFVAEADRLASLARLLWLAAATLLPACIACGMALPLLMEMAGARSPAAGPVLGRLLGANTVGAVVGPLLVTFMLTPWLGLWASLVALGALTLTVGVLAGLARGERGLACAVLVLEFVGFRPTRVAPVRLRPGETLVSVREGSYGTTAVLDDGRDRWISVNSAYVLGGAAAASEERFQGLLPLLLHPAPRRVAYLGMGTGITAGAALLQPVKEVVALEIVPEVVDAARDEFGGLNAHLVTDARVRVVIDDGRNYLAAAAPGSFDVIVGDLLVPWRAGESSLYTREHFEGVRRALAPDGVFCQWLPLYQLSREQLAILLRTFLDVFPQTTVWRGNFLAAEPTLGLVGQRRAVALDVEAVDRRVRALAPSGAAASPLLADPAGVWLSLVGPVGADVPWSLGARRNCDDEPLLELARPGRQVLLTGETAEPLLEPIAHAALEGTPLARLPAAHRGWRDTGMALGQATLLPGPAGMERVYALLRTLPAGLRQALGVQS